MPLVSRCGICLHFQKPPACVHAPKLSAERGACVRGQIVRPLRVVGYDDAPHGHAEVEFNNVRLPRTAIIGGPGRGFEIAQGRLGPGRIHHCMRLLGMCERSVEWMCARVDNRVAFGKPLSAQGGMQDSIAESRMDIEQARLLTLNAAHLMDTVGNKSARSQISQIKVVAPRIAERVIDRAMQAHGAMGLSQDTPMAHFWVRPPLPSFAGLLNSLLCVSFHDYASALPHTTPRALAIHVHRLGRVSSASRTAPMRCIPS